jgi:hypothetical protein
MPSSASSTRTVTDSGGLATALRHPAVGREQIVRAFVDLAATLSKLTILERTVNGQPGLIAQHNGITVTVYAFDFADGRITHIWAIRNPEKLRPWTTN